MFHESILGNTPKPEAPKATFAKSNSASKSASGISNATPYSGRNYSKEEVIQLIKDYSAQYKIDSSTPLCIASRESGFNQFSRNRSSSASGIFQYLSETWRSTDEAKTNLSVFDADANIRAAIKFMAIHKSTRPWVTRGSCLPLKFL